MSGFAVKRKRGIALRNDLRIDIRDKFRYMLCLFISKNHSPVLQIILPFYTAKNGTDFLQVFNFTGLLQLVNNVKQTCQLHQVATSLLKSGLLPLVSCIRLQAACG